jgi:hypothetical protein
MAAQQPNAKHARHADVGKLAVCLGALEGLTLHCVSVISVTLYDFVSV